MCNSLPRRVQDETARAGCQTLGVGAADDQAGCGCNLTVSGEWVCHVLENTQPLPVSCLRAPAVLGLCLCRLPNSFWV